MGEDEFRTLHREMADRLFAFAARRLPPENARDVVSDTFLVVWAKRVDCPLDTAARSGWVFQICKYKILQEAQRVRRKHHDNRFIEDYATAHPAGPEDVADLVSETLVGHQVYRLLSEKERELFDVAFMHGMTRTEGAAMLELSVVAFNTRVSRLRSKIEALYRDAVNDGDAEDPDVAV